MAKDNYIKSIYKFINEQHSYREGDIVKYDGSNARVIRIIPTRGGDKLHLDWNDELIEVGIDELDNTPATTDNGSSDSDDSLLAEQNLEIEVEYLDGRDARVVTLKQGLNKITIPEDKVDHYMSEIMGMLDAGFKPNGDDDDEHTPSRSFKGYNERPDDDNWEDELPKFN